MLNEIAHLKPCSLQRCTIGFLLCLFAFGAPAIAQEAADTLSAEEESLTSWDEGELIELEAVQIEGEIAQPNVAITVARLEPQFREIALERTPAVGLTDLGFSAEELEALEAAAIIDWSEILERPRQ